MKLGTSLVAQWVRLRLPMQGHGFDPWPRKRPHAVEQTSLCTTTTEPALWSPQATSTGACEPRLLKPTRLEPVLRNKRSHHKEKPVHRNEEQLPLATTRESPHASHEDPTQPKINKN